MMSPEVMLPMWCARCDAGVVRTIIKAVQACAPVALFFMHEGQRVVIVGQIAEVDDEFHFTMKRGDAVFYANVLLVQFLEYVLLTGLALACIQSRMGDGCASGSCAWAVRCRAERLHPEFSCCA